jgi:hypothetical protein
MPLDLEKLEDSDHLLNTLIDIEDILDSNDIYVWRNWISGEIIEGPIIKRHWVKIGLLYPYRKMPDPRASLRLMKLGIMVEFSKMRRHADKHDPVEKAEEKEDHEKNLYWIVELKVPRRLLNDIEDDMEDEEEEIDIDDVGEAQDSGINPEDAYQDDQQAGDFIDPSQQDAQDAQPEPNGQGF